MSTGFVGEVGVGVTCREVVVRPCRVCGSLRQMVGPLLVCYGSRRKPSSSKPSACTTGFWEDAAIIGSLLLLFVQSDVEAYFHHQRYMQCRTCRDTTGVDQKIKNTPRFIFYSERRLLRKRKIGPAEQKVH